MKAMVQQANTTPLPPVLIPRRRPAKLRPPAKASKEEIEDRRKQVARLRLRGLGYRSIAKILNVGHMTIKRDLEAIREENKRRVSGFEHAQMIGESLSVFEEVELRAWQDYHDADKGSVQRRQFLDVIQNARNNQIKLLTDIGLVSKEPHKVDVTVRTDAIEHWSPEAQALVAMAILKAKLSPPADPVPELVIDTTAEECDAQGVTPDMGVNSSSEHEPSSSEAS